MRSVGLGVAVAIFALPRMAYAQSLANIPGQTSLQTRVGAAVAATCGGLAAAGVNPLGAADDEDLFGRCRELVQNGNEVVGAGAAAFSLGLNADQLNDALLQVSHDEAPAQGTDSTETASAQVQNVSARIAALQAGATGFSTAGLNLYRNGERQQALAPSGTASGQDGDFNGLGGFINGTVGFGDVDGSAEEAGFDFNTYGLTAGVDYFLNDNAIIGVAIGYGFNDSDFNNGSNLDKDTFTVSIYTSVFHDNGLYLDGIATFGWNNYDFDRRIVYANVNRTATSDTNAFEYSFTGTGGYDMAAESWSFGPYVRVSYLRTDIDGFAESGAQGLNLTFASQNVDSLTTVVGFQVQNAVSTEFGVLTPYVRAEYEHEFADDSRRINVRYTADPNANVFFVQTDSPDRNFFNLGGGVAAVFAGGFTAFLDFDALVGRSDINSYTFTFGVRKEF